MFSEALLASLILQAAYTAIRLYSPKRPVPDEWRQYIKPSQEAACFCIGKPKHKVPTGLIVYAGRNQFAHWDKQAWPVTQRVFDLLAAAFDNNPHWDLIFELKNMTVSICAGPLLFLALGWKSYDLYLAEMTELLTG
jgi:hypothetical protein